MVIFDADCHISSKKLDGISILADDLLAKRITLALTPERNHKRSIECMESRDEEIYLWVLSAPRAHRRIASQVNDPEDEAAEASWLPTPARMDPISAWRCEFTSG